MLLERKSFLAHPDQNGTSGCAAASTFIVAELHDVQQADKHRVGKIEWKKPCKRFTHLMKNITLIAVTALLVGMVAPAQAGPLDFLFKSRPDQRDNRHDDHRRDNDRGFDRGNERRRPMSREARAQLRLRELGYYRGGIDGSFGRGSIAALIRFQRDNRIRPTGWLDERTRRALRI